MEGFTVYQFQFCEICALTIYGYDHHELGVSPERVAGIAEWAAEQGIVGLSHLDTDGPCDACGEDADLTAGANVR